MDTKHDLNNPEYYLNRHLSNLEFNSRVLEQAQDYSHGLLDRLNFVCIFSSNLDEFFEVRVAGLKQQLAFSREETDVDGLHPQVILELIRSKTQDLVAHQYRLFNDLIVPELREQNIRFLRRNEWDQQQASWVKKYFRENVQPVISPIGLDPSHPFPRLVNKSLNFIVSLEGKDAFGRDSGLAIIPAPRSLPRVIRMPNELCEPGDNFIFLSSMIHQHADELFPGMNIKGCYQFRVTRNADLQVQEDYSDLAIALKGELHSRKYGDGVRLEVAGNCPEELANFLLGEFGLSENELYRVNGPVNLHRLMQVSKLVSRPDLTYPPLTPGLAKSLKFNQDIFATMRQGDILLLHPFQSFTPVIDLLRQAAQDPAVLSIRQTLYRTGDKSSIVDALIEAARNGKEVTVVIELLARFDEEGNIYLASRLQEAGCVVVYGVVGYKTHAKMISIVRQEGDKLRRYAQLGTGNYHAGNARMYTDYSLLTCDESINDDVHKIFQQLTGMGKVQRIKKVFHSPFNLHSHIVSCIDRETEIAKAGHKARVIIKVNGFTEYKMIKALYRASQAGVEVRLIVRGMCCLRPGIKKVSENIEVRSIIGRFLEHTRVYYFHNKGADDIYIASADSMERNMFKRVETCCPIEAAPLKKRMKKELEIYLKDNTHSWVLQPDGSYVRTQPAADEEPVSAQKYLLESLGG